MIIDVLHYMLLSRVAKEVEKIVKNNGAIPATVAIMSGKIHVGMYEKKSAKI